MDLPLAPGAEDRIEVEAAGLELEAAPGWYSPRYGVREPTTFLQSRRLSPSRRGRDRDQRQSARLTSRQYRARADSRPAGARGRGPSLVKKVAVR